MINYEGLLKNITSAKRLVIFLHDKPDPDAMASGWMLQHIAAHVGVRSIIVHGGRLGRAENRAMVRLLKIPLRLLDDKPLRVLQTDHFAMVDTQPGTGNNSLPFWHRCHIVIDHHPPRRNLEADFIDIRPGEGCTTTMLVDYFRHYGLKFSPQLATAVAYAIVSETQDLKREATRADREAFHFIYPQVQLKVLGQIRHPARSRDYYRTIARAMRGVLLSKNTLVCHIGPVQSAEMVAEVADFLVSMERITWCLVTGLADQKMVLSIRTNNPKGRAERIMRRMLGHLGKGGGHGMIAGGVIPLPDMISYSKYASQMTERFLALLSHRQVDHLKPLLNEGA